MKKIPLTRGKFALVDDEDFEALNEYKWQLTTTMWGSYATRKIKIGEKKITKGMHRLLLNPKDDELVDHINGNGLDNRRCNIRTCSHAQNTRNKSIPKNNTSGYKGVHWSKKNKNWISQIVINSKAYHVGSFSEIKIAAIAYNMAAIKCYGEFALLNKIPE